MCVCVGSGSCFNWKVNFLSCCESELSRLALQRLRCLAASGVIKAAELMAEIVGQPVVVMELDLYWFSVI